MLNTEECYFILNKDGTKKFYSYKTRQCVHPNQIISPDNVKAEPYFFCLRIEELKDKILDLNRKIYNYDKIFRQYGVDPNQLATYEATYLERENIATDNDCYIVFAADGKKLHYRYSDGKGTKKLNYLVENGIEKCKLVEKYLDWIEEIEGFKGDIILLEQKIKKIGKSKEDIIRDWINRTTN